MTLGERFRRLTFWNKTNIWGALASIVGLVIAIIGIVLAVLFWLKPREVAAPYRSEDFRLRLCVISVDLTQKHLSRVPRVAHVRGRLGLSSVEFDLRQVETLTGGYSRGRSIPELCYEAEHWAIFNLRLLNQRGIYEEHLRFPVPYSLQTLTGEKTSCNADLFVREQWNMQGIKNCGDGIDIEISPPRQ